MTTYAVPQSVRPTSQRMTLLDLAKAAEKDRWFSGETSWLVGDRLSGGAYLANDGGLIRLRLTTGGPGLTVYALTSDGWKQAKDLDRRYQDWKQVVEAVTK